MITPPTGWIVERTGDGFVLCPPDGPDRALLRYAERRRPIRRAMQLVDAAAVPPGFVAQATSRPRRLTTAEGEHAALVTRSGRIGDAAVVLVHGYVFLDDYYAALEGIVRADAPALLATVEQLLIADLHLLGRERRRRFIYTPPAGWQGTGTVFDARWYPLDYPANPARIFVNPALPAMPGLAATIVERMLAGAAVAAAPAVMFRSRGGLDGEHHHLRTRELDTHLFFLTDQHFFYSVRADADVDAGRALVDTIEPVPHFQRPSAEAFHFWTE
jgi:hypothetical protein